MGDISTTVDFILGNEDPGLTGVVTSGVEDGKTWYCRWGIDSRSWPNVDVPNLTLADAKEIYSESYVTPYSSILSQDVQDRVCDTLVNPGPFAGAKCVQRAVDWLYPGALVEDGVIGPKTIWRLNIPVAEIIIPKLRGSRALHYFENDQGPNLIGLIVRACR